MQSYCNRSRFSIHFPIFIIKHSDCLLSTEGQILRGKMEPPTFGYISTNFYSILPILTFLESLHQGLSNRIKPVPRIRFRKTHLLGVQLLVPGDSAERHSCQRGERE